MVTPNAGSASVLSGGERRARCVCRSGAASVDGGGHFVFVTSVLVVVVVIGAARDHRRAADSRAALLESPAPELGVRDQTASPRRACQIRHILLFIISVICFIIVVVVRLPSVCRLARGAVRRRAEGRHLCARASVWRRFGGRVSAAAARRRADEARGDQCGGEEGSAAAVSGALMTRLFRLSCVSSANALEQMVHGV
jgi:hypothetical protein